MNMNHEDFCREVTAAAAAKKAVDAFARTQADGMHICPRCGRQTIKNRLSANALSRCADVYICDACGMDEAIREAANNTLPLKDWAIATINR